MRDYGSLDQRSIKRNEETWIDSGHILQVETTDGLDMGGGNEAYSEGKEGIKQDSWNFVSRDQMDSNALSRDGET